MVSGAKSHTKDVADMIEKLPAIQKFLLFLSKNVTALLLVLFCLSLAGNIYLVKALLDEKKASDAFKDSTIAYERQRGEKLEGILHEQIFPKHEK